MKHVIFPVILAITVPVFAADETPVAQPQPVAASDSPLVAAAKRANRLGKKPAILITNDNLVHVNDGRGFTTASNQANVTAPKGTAAPTPEMAAAAAAQKDAQHRADVAATQKKQQDVKNAKAAQREQMYENENFLDEDPARHEGAMEALSKDPQPQPTSQPQQSSNTSQPQQSQKPPQD